MLLNDVAHVRTLHLFFVYVAIIHRVVTILKNWQTRDKCLLVSVKKTKKDSQTEEHRCHSESAITRAVSVKKTKEDMQTEEHICHSEGTITGAGGVKRINCKASDQLPAKRNASLTLSCSLSSTSSDSFPLAVAS